MKSYELVNFDGDVRKIVLSTSYVSPLSKVFLVSKDLESQGYKGEVLFDLLLSNGFSQNRFLKMIFDGDKINPKTSEIINEVPCILMNEIYEFYYSHPEYVENSILSDAQKYLIKNKLMIKA